MTSREPGSPPLRISEGGNITIIFALLLMVLVAAVGSSIDYIRLVNQRTELASAVDAAVLAAATAATQSEKAGRSTAQQAGLNAAMAMWKANVGTWLEDSATQPKIVVTKKGSIWSATLDYDGKYPTQFMSLVGIHTMRLKAHAEASTAIGKTQNFWQFSVAVDTSNSMGIGATSSDMKAISDKVQAGCTFACHFTGTHFYFKNTYKMAHDLGIKLRLDVVNDAVDAMIDKMEAIDDGTHVKARLVGLDRDATELVAMTNNLSNVADYELALTEAVVLPTVASATGDTDYDVSFDTLTNMVGSSGDGSSAASPRKAVFIVTDGVHDSYYDEPNAVYKWSNQHHLGPIDPKFCKAMKDSGAVVGVLYIDYIPPTGMEYLITPYQDNILSNLQGCATDGMFHNAQSPSEIKDALADMLQEALASGNPRLTQ